MMARALAANSICDLTLGTRVDQNQRLLGPHDVGGATTLVLNPSPAFLLWEKEIPFHYCIY